MYFLRPLFRRPWRALPARLLPLLALLACSDSTGIESHVGFYDMTQFAGKPLPSGDGTIFIRSAVIELRSGGRFQLDMDRDHLGEDDALRHTGNYTISGGSITLNTEDGPLTGAIFPTYIRIDDGANPSIWVKRE